MLIRAIAVLAAGLCAAGAADAARSGKISQTDYHFKKPTTDLKSALHRFERDLAGKPGTGRARSSKPKEIVVVGSKIKETARSSRAPARGFKSVSGLDSETDVVEFREGGEPRSRAPVPDGTSNTLMIAERPASLGPLQAAIRRFESAAGPKSPCVGRCRAAGRRCLSRCRRSLTRTRAQGRCICDHIQARCLVQAAKRGACHPREPVRPRRR